MRATASEARRENVTVMARSLNMCPAMLCIKTTGRNTAIVVSVEAVIARETSAVPSMAAVRGESPSSCLRKMFSNTTMELSTTIPTPRANPPRVSRFTVSLKAYIMTNANMIESGIETATKSVLPKWRKNRKRTATASSAPMPAFSARLVMEFVMNTD